MIEEYSLHTASRRGGVSPIAEVGHLVRRAMSCLETDRAVAWRCLTDASLLLGTDSNEPPPPLRAAPVTPQCGGLPQWRAKRALEYIDAHLGSKINIGEVAGVVALSKSHFSRAFKHSMGLPLMTYVANRRVERAKLMMTSTRERLSDIALACGFADQSHLSRCFRRVVGVSPGWWRRTLPSPRFESPCDRGADRLGSAFRSG